MCVCVYLSIYIYIYIYIYKHNVSSKKLKDPSGEPSHYSY